MRWQWSLPEKVEIEGFRHLGNIKPQREREREPGKTSRRRLKDLHKGFPSLCRSTIHWAPLSQILSYLNQIAASWTDAANCRGEKCDHCSRISILQACTLSYLESRPGHVCSLWDPVSFAISMCKLEPVFWLNADATMKEFRLMSSVPVAAQWFHEHSIEACRHLFWILAKPIPYRSLVLLTCNGGIWCNGLAVN